jgi:hypothetical protein
VSKTNILRPESNSRGLLKTVGLIASVVAAAYVGTGVSTDDRVKTLDREVHVLRERLNRLESDHAATRRAMIERNRHDGSR